jgi:hypothetical protein
VGDTPTDDKIVSTLRRGGSRSVVELARSAARTVAVGEDVPSSSSRAVLAQAPDVWPSGAELAQKGNDSWLIDPSSDRQLRVIVVA